MVTRAGVASLSMEGQTNSEGESLAAVNVHVDGSRNPAPGRREVRRSPFKPASKAAVTKRKIRMPIPYGVSLDENDPKGKKRARFIGG